MRRYWFILYVVFVSTSPLLGILLFSWFPVLFLLSRQNPWFLRQFTVLPRVLRAVLRVVRGGRDWGMGPPVWIGGVFSLVPDVNQACSLTCQTDSRFWVPAQILFLQGTGDMSSADHPWVLPCNGDCDASIYLPPYFQKGFFPFLFLDLTQLRAHD